MSKAQMVGWYQRAQRGCGFSTD